MSKEIDKIGADIPWMTIDDVVMNRLREFARNGRVVAFDTETTGGTVNDEICQIGAVEIVKGKIGEKKNIYIRPGCPIDPFAESVHGLSADFLSRNGRDPRDAMQEFFAFLGAESLLVAHNVPFDVGMVRIECGKYGIVDQTRTVATCDTVALARFLLPTTKNLRLWNLIEELGVDGDNSHDAMDDALACGLVFLKLLEKEETARKAP